MAILKGFPPSNTISPSVRITEKDLSFVAPEQTAHRAGIVGFASKGPLNIPTPISTRRQLNTVFGYPHPESGDPYLIYAAEQYLLVANELYVVRVGETDNVNSEAATSAMVDVSATGGRVEILSDVVAAGGDPLSGGTFYDLANDDELPYYFRFKLNGILSSKTLVVLEKTQHPDTGVQTNGYTAAQLAEDLNSQLIPDIDGIEFYVDSNKIGVRSVFSFGSEASIEFVSVQNAIYGPTSYTPTGLGQGMTVASSTGTVNVDFDFDTVTDPDLQVVVDGTDNVNIDNVIQVLDLSSLSGTKTVTEVVTEINTVLLPNLPGGFEAAEGSGANAGKLVLRTLHHGRDAKILVKPDSTASELFGFDNITSVGETPSGATGGTVEDFGLVTGGTGAGGTTFTLMADSPGVDGNATQVVIKNNTREGNFTMEVYNNGVQVESWGNLTKDETSRFYVETFLSLVSDYVRVSDNASESAPPSDGTYSLSGGNDGIPADPDDQDSLLIGSLTGMSGIYALSEPEQINIDVVAVPGHSSTGVILALIDMCQNLRSDCMALIDPPFGLTVTEVVQWQNGVHPLNSTRFDSDFAALYWPWVKIRDIFNNVDVWVPPSGSIMAVYARNDFLGRPWFAPAGTTRGVVPNITDVFSRPTLEERDLMYGNRNAVNPIVQYVESQDFVVWGQKTLQRKPTALDRVNVRRLMFYIEKEIRSASKVLLFEPNDEIFRSNFIQIASKILEDVQVGRGLTDFIIKADEELNTPDVIDRNEFRARIGIQPTRAVEFMFIEFSIHRTGSFTETADSF